MKTRLNHFSDTSASADLHSATRLPRLQEVLLKLDGRNAKIAVIGQGYVGLPLAIRASHVGFRVVGYDVSQERIASLHSGHSYVEDVSDKELRRALGAMFVATSDPNDLELFDVAIITVPTPLRDGIPDLSYIETAAAALVPHLRPSALVVLESTTYPGTTQDLLRPALERSGLSASRDFFLGYSPERIDPGNSQWNLVNTPKVVSGTDAAALLAVERFYGTLVDKVIPVKSPAEAELAKLLENTFRHVNIALVNELSVFAHDLGIDIWSAIDAASTKPFGFMRFTPGPGAGGHCLPIDPSFLAWRVERQLGHQFRFVELANDVNRQMPQQVVSRVTALLNGQKKAVNGARILICGLAYKRGTSDWRESPSMAVAERLASLGADLRAHDSYVGEKVDLGLPLLRVPCTTDEIATADLVVILVDHPDLPYDEICERASLVLDTKGCLIGRRFRGEAL